MIIPLNRLAGRSIKAAVLSILFSTSAYSAESAISPLELSVFSKIAARETGYDVGEITTILSGAEFRSEILDSISKPAEDMPWYIYEKRVITSTKVENGKAFLDQFKDELDIAEDKYGVPREIIAAVIGIESGYGMNKGKIRVIDALGTLAFNFPRRSKFFKFELLEYLRLTKDNNLDPSTVMGSYAGAIGWPQFMPSSARRLAIDFNQDGRIDLINSPVDAIGSVANYLSKSGWVKGGAAVRSANSNESGSFRLESVDGDGVFFMPQSNFRVILKYNKSRHYAMAVLILSEKIKDAYDDQIEYGQMTFY